MLAERVLVDDTEGRAGVRLGELSRGPLYEDAEAKQEGRLENLSVLSIRPRRNRSRFLLAGLRSSPAGRL